VLCGAAVQLLCSCAPAATATAASCVCALCANQGGATLALQQLAHVPHVCILHT
jgi:hypothetical protein